SRQGGSLMRLVSFVSEPFGDTKIGALVDGDSTVVDLSRAQRASGSSGASPSIPSDMTTFLEGGAAMMEAARSAIESASSRGYEGVSYARGDVRLVAPVPRPRKVLGIGGNFPELTSTWPEPPAVPPVFQRAASSIIGPEDDVVIPKKVTYLQPE